MGLRGAKLPSVQRCKKFQVHLCIEWVVPGPILPIVTFIDYNMNSDQRRDRTIFWLACVGCIIIGSMLLIEAARLVSNVRVRSSSNSRRIWPEDLALESVISSSNSRGIWPEDLALESVKSKKKQPTGTSDDAEIGSIFFVAYHQWYIFFCLILMFAAV